MNLLTQILEDIEEKAVCSGNEEHGFILIKHVRKILEKHLSNFACKCGNCSRRRFYQVGYRDGKEKNDWIPVEEGLPKERDSMFATLKGTDKWSKTMFEKISDDVNVTVEYEDGTRKTMAAHTLDGQWKLPNRMLKQKVIAWCPFPESYKADKGLKDVEGQRNVEKFRMEYKNSK